jgi:Pyruvate/2-oxoacid:ferredoxin oxidoreductase delta subunit
MCEYCEKYGDGTYWYLNPQNYGRQLYGRRRPGYVPDAISYRKERDQLWAEYFEAVADESEKTEELKEKLDILIRENEPCQVVPLKDCLKMMEIVQPVASMSCICRKYMRAADERSPAEYSCGGLGVGMLKWERWPERYRGGVHFMSEDEAKDWVTKFDKKGMVHCVMVYGSSYGGRPFVGGLCNCDYPDCYEMRHRLDYHLEHHLLRSHYVAMIDYDLCNGCGICAQRCQFGAIKMEHSKWDGPKANIDMFRCFGCGLCETGCPRGAIKLVERETIPMLKEVW